MTQSEATPAQPTPQERFTSLIVTLSRLVDGATDHALPRGDISALRREDGARSPTFYKLAALVLEDVMPASPALREEAERRWARVVHLLARTAGQHALSAPSTDTALAEAELAEPRFLRLLRAEGDAIDATSRAALAPLVQRAVTFDPRDLAALVLSAPHPKPSFHHEDGERVRRRLARDFYRAAAKAESDTKRS